MCDIEDRYHRISLDSNNSQLAVHGYCWSVVITVIGASFVLILAMITIVMWDLESESMSSRKSELESTISLADAKRGLAINHRFRLQEFVISVKAAAQILVPDADLYPSEAAAQLADLSPLEVTLARLDNDDVAAISACIANNVPAVINARAEVSQWRVAAEWVTSAGDVNIDGILAAAGADRGAPGPTVRVEDCGAGAGYGERNITKMPLREYAEYWQSDRDRCLYLKDWHFVKEKPDYILYECPLWARDDWLNGWSDATACNDTNADYRFVYLGPRGSWTAAHTDVLRSLSWSANIVGRKRWLLLHPRLTHLLHGGFSGRQMAPALEPGEGFTGEGFPRLAEARAAAVEIIQQPGEVILVPSGWYHTVENLDDCLSVNHNWMMASTVLWTLALLEHNHRFAEARIEHCRELYSAQEFSALLARNVRANNCGIGLKELAEICRWGARVSAKDKEAAQNVLDKIMAMEDAVEERVQ